jgi:hypothetical protein
MELIIGGEIAAPFVRVDNRTLVLSSGARAIGFPLSSAGVWIEETLLIILDDGRATRSQGDRWFGGFRSEDKQRITLYGGERDDLVVIVIAAAEFERLKQAVTDSVHHR